MRARFLIPILAAFWLALTAGVPPWYQGGAIPVAESASPPSVKAASALLMDAATGAVLYAKEANTRREPASTTKILTALILLEDFPDRLADMVTISPEAAAQEGTRADLRPGQRVAMQELLYATLLGSANDAAYAIAEHLAGNLAAFVDLLNQKAQALGARNSHFENPSGLPGSNHYSTAFDLAVITRHALSLPAFAQVVRTGSTQLSWLKEPTYNHNQFLFSYEGADGVKNGYTERAGHTLVASATRNGRQLIAVVLGSDRANVTNDSRLLLDYGFNQFTNVTVVTAGEPILTLAVPGVKEILPVAAAEDVTLLMDRDKPFTPRLRMAIHDPLRAPIAQHKEIGKLEVLHDTAVIASVPLVAAGHVPKGISPVLAGLGRFFIRVIYVLAALFVLRAFLKARLRRRRRLRRRYSALNS